MSVVERIKQNYDRMTKSDRQAATYFLCHVSDFAFYTLEKIADDVGISTASVIRFCRRLGFSGFKAFQDALRADLKLHPDLSDKLHRTLDISQHNELLTQTIQQGIGCVQRTFQQMPHDKLSQAVQQIAAAKRVFTFGMKESFALAHYAYSRILSVRPNTFLLNAGYNGEVEALLSLTRDDVCLVFLFHRYTKQALSILSMLKKQGVRVILITSAPYDSVEALATVLLPCHVDANGIKNSALAPVCLADYLCNALAVAGGEATMQYMQASEALFRESAVLGS